ncbi:MAG TPA: nucleoside 2-deoxyribosyltransferase [Candidatus Saccharimonadales bacterium]
MKLFCSYAYTGEDIAVVKKRTRLVVDTLTAHGHEVYCPLFDEVLAPFQEANDVKVIFQRAFEAIEQQEALVVIVSSERRSAGQLMEIGAALSRHKPVYLMQHKTAAGSSYLPKLVTKTFIWETDAELQKQLATID